MLGAGFAEGDLGQGPALHPVEELVVVWKLEIKTPGSAKFQWGSEASVSILDLSPRTVGSQWHAGSSCQ